MLRYIAFLLLFLFSPVWSVVSVSPAEGTSLDTRQVAAYRACMRLSLKEAGLKRESGPAHPLNAYLETLEKSLQLLLTHDPKGYQAFNALESTHLRQVRQVGKESAWYGFAQAEIRHYHGLLKYKYGDQFAAFWNFRAAYFLLEDCIKQHPDFLPARKSMGLYYAVLGNVPQKYQWAIGLMGFRPDAEKGVAWLEEVAEKDTVFGLEAALSRASLDAFFLGKEEQGFRSLHALAKANPGHALVLLAACWAGTKAGRGAEVKTLLQQAPPSADPLFMPFFYYLEGTTALQTGQYQQAICILEKFLATYTGEVFVKNAHLMLFMAKWFLNQPDAQEHLKKIRDGEAAAISESDKYADKFARYEHLPDKALTEARCLYDGGELTQALRIMSRLKEAQFTRIKDKTEYHYRYGQIWLRLEEPEKAKLSLLKAIELGKDSGYYFAPNAALQLGALYRDRYQDRETARTYFQMALDMKKDEYQESLEFKARAGLTSVKGRK